MTAIAFAGSGWVTAIHGLAAAGVPDLRVVHVASRSPRAARRRASQVGAVACTYNELPGGAEAVVVATPPADHLAQARRAVEGGAGVLVEAPLAATLADADELVRLADEGALIAYGENLVHAPPVAEAVRTVRRLGTLTFLEVRLAQGQPDRRGHLRPRWGGGALFDLGVHAVALTMLLAAPARVVEVEARLGTPEGLDVDDDARLTLVFDSGLRAQVRATWRAAAPAWDAQAASADGAARLELVPEPGVELNGAPIRLPDSPDDLSSPQLYNLGYTPQLAALVADVAANRAPRTSAALGRTVLDVVCAAYVAAGRGRAEPLPFTGRRDRTPHELWQDALDEAADTADVDVAIGTDTAGTPDSPDAATSGAGHAGGSRAGGAGPAGATATGAAGAAPAEPEGPQPDGVDHA
jgi:predicted dehydrogenase